MDPFFAELHRRHPDIDIVLVPPRPAETPPDEHTEAAVIEALARVVTRRRR